MLRNEGGLTASTLLNRSLVASSSAAGFFSELAFRLLGVKKGSCLPCNFDVFRCNFGRVILGLLEGIQATSMVGAKHCMIHGEG